MDAGDNRSAMSADRRFLNPLYSDNRLKLGVFGANVSNGCAATTDDPLGSRIARRDAGISLRAPAN
jgi:hypothetical protein